MDASRMRTQAAGVAGVAAVAGGAGTCIGAIGLPIVLQQVVRRQGGGAAARPRLPAQGNRLRRCPECRHHPVHERRLPREHSKPGHKALGQRGDEQPEEELQPGVQRWLPSLLSHFGCPDGWRTARIKIKAVVEADAIDQA